MIEVGGSDEPTRMVRVWRDGSLRLTTLTKEYFHAGFLERDECERNFVASIVDGCAMCGRSGSSDYGVEGVY